MFLMKSSVLITNKWSSIAIRALEKDDPLISILARPFFSLEFGLRSIISCFLVNSERTSVLLLPHRLWPSAGVTVDTTLAPRFISYLRIY